MSRVRLQQEAGTILVVLLYGLFVAANVSRWRETGQPVGLGVTVLEGATMILFALRRRPLAVSKRPLAWLAAPVGSFSILLARPVAQPLIGPLHLFAALQFLGIGLALVCLGVLGRSFGIIAANRGVKTGGVYRVVRHPLYSAYLISHLGYILENMSVRNVLVLALGIGAQLLRIEEEERVLSEDAAYRNYAQSVRYRLLPPLY